MIDPSRQLFYKLGCLLNKGYMLDKHITLNPDYYPKTKLFEINANIIIKNTLMKKLHPKYLPGVNNL